MLILLSPSKTLDETPMTRRVEASTPLFQEQTRMLHAVMKKKTPVQLMQLMGISEKLAALNHTRFQAFDPSLYAEHNAKPALFLFKGDVYAPMDVERYDAATLQYAQAHLRILSGLYGLLAPLDYVQPYRLEMGTRLAVGRAKGLYAFWGGLLSEALNNAAEGMQNPVVVNLASEEYFKAVDRRALKVPLLNVQFKEKKGDGYRIVGLMAKRARGMMADYMLRNRVDTVEGVQAFDAAGYRFHPPFSDAQTFVFVR